MGLILVVEILTLEYSKFWWNMKEIIENSLFVTSTEIFNKVKEEIEQDGCIKYLWSISCVKSLSNTWIQKGFRNNFSSSRPDFCLPIS